MDRLAIIQVIKIVETTVRFSDIENGWNYGHRLAVFQGKKVGKTTVLFSNLENDYNYGYIGYHPSQKNCWNFSSISLVRKWLKLWID